MRKHRVPRNGKPYFGHDGADEGFQAHGVMMMGNSDKGSEVFAEMRHVIAAEYGWEREEEK